MIKGIDQEFWYILPDLDLVIFKSSNPTITILYANHWFKVAICYESSSLFFGKSIRTHGLVVVKVQESGDMGSSNEMKFPASPWPFCY